MESGQAHEDLTSLLKIQESCNTETVHGISLHFPSGRKISTSPDVLMTPQRFPTLQTLALLHVLTAILTEARLTLRVQGISTFDQNASLSLSPISVFKMGPTLPSKIPTLLCPSDYPVSSVHFQNQHKRGYITNTF